MRPITAADLMNPKVLAVRDDLTLRELAGFLIRNQITGAPVEDGGGRLVGVVSTVDIAEAVLAGRGGGGEEPGEGAEPTDRDDPDAGEGGEEPSGAPAVAGGATSAWGAAVASGAERPSAPAAEDLD